LDTRGGTFLNSEDLLNVIYPPQWVAKILYLFISGAQNQDCSGIKTELIYFVIPIISIDLIREKLKHANSRSSFDSILEQQIYDKRNCFINFSSRVESFIKITNFGLIQLGNEVELKFGDFITASKPIKYNPSEYKDSRSFDDSDFFKASYYLGLIFAKEDYKNIFLKFGVLVK